MFRLLSEFNVFSGLTYPLSLEYLYDLDLVCPGNPSQFEGKTCSINKLTYSVVNFLQDSHDT